MQGNSHAQHKVELINNSKSIFRDPFLDKSCEGVDLNGDVNWESDKELNKEIVAPPRQGNQNLVGDSSNVALTPVVESDWAERVGIPGGERIGITT